MLRSNIKSHKPFFSLVVTSSFSLKQCNIQKQRLIDSWDTFFNETNQPNQSFNRFDNVKYNKDNLSLSFQSGDAYISNCFFESTSASIGGAISFESSGSHLLVEFSTFLKCTATSESGAISVKAGDVVMNMICGYECFSSNQFGFSRVFNDNTRDKNVMLQCAVASCRVNDKCIVEQSFGHVETQSVNFSGNYASSRSALDLWPSKKESNFGSVISFTCFAHNIAQFQRCITLDNAGAPTYKIHHSNIIDNKGDNTIYMYGTAEISDSCIMDNKIVNNVFYLYSNDCSMTLIRCSCDNFSAHGNLIQQEPTESFIHGLTFIHSGSCVNIFDTVGSLKPTNMRNIYQTLEREQYDNEDGKRYMQHNMMKIAKYLFLLAESQKR